MFRIHALSVLCLLGTFAISITISEARPVTISAASINMPCDVVLPTSNHELGAGTMSTPVTGPFSAMESISWAATTTQSVACQQNYQQGVNTLVTITNQTGLYWDDLWFVADGEVITDVQGMIVGPVLTNADAQVTEVAVLTTFGLGFRIDGTVTMGINNPLVSESMTTDEIFEPGETWTFIVQEWGPQGSMAFMPGGCGSSIGIVTFDSLGVGGVSCNNPNAQSNASIIARLRPTQMTEPGTLAVLSLGLIGLGYARRRKAAV